MLSFLRVCSAALALGAFALLPAHAAAPQVKTQAPGYYRVMLGDFEVTALSVNGYLINTGTKLVLIFTGAAKLFGPTLGNLADNLRAAGYQPEQVDEVYITHMHADHVGGLMNGDKLAFPNAVVRADQHDAEGQTLVLWGDLMHVAAVQFADPAVTIQFDTDSKAAAVQRKRAYAEAAKRGDLVGSAHLSFPGLGHLRADGKGYAWVPLNYSGLK